MGSCRGFTSPIRRKMGPFLLTPAPPPMTVDFSAIAKWPDVPACYGWLSLDRRGDWRLQGERVTHRGLIAFMNRQYASDKSGCWFVQNGPQRVFVTLDYTPWVFRCEGNALLSHTGEPAGEALVAWCDEQGNILLETRLGVGLLDDRELAGFVSACRDGKANPVDDSVFADLMQGFAPPLFWGGVPIQPIRSEMVAARYEFVARPQP